ncbi:MAG: 6-hydroxymethylpterin diphosphokinase MptE-like protein [Phycisphaerae bacterium]
MKTPIPDIWLKNLEALYKADMRFAQELDDLPKDDCLVIEPAQNGSMTIKAHLPDGKEIYLHSKYNPQSEAKKFVDGLDLKKNLVVVLSGIGLGYHVREIFDRTSSQTIVVVLEPQLGVIRAALWNIDFSEELKKNRLIFLHRVDKGLMHAKLSAASSSMILGTTLETLVYSKMWNADFHIQMRAVFTEFMFYCRMSFVTLLSNCKLTQQNVANNLVSYVCCPPIDNLRRRFVGYPAIVVSAGPSLAKNMHLLKQAKGKAVIIAAQTVLKPLLNLGVEPDFVTSLDYNPISQKFFEGIKDFGQVQLIAEPKVTWPVVDVFTGKKRLLYNEFAEQCLGPMHQKRDGLRAGSTVAHLSFYLAEYIGTDPIILIGQDLGFSDNMYYAPGNIVHDMWAVELNRFCTLETKEWERIVRNRDILRKTVDIHGRQIFTDEQMFTYLQQFERDFANTASTVIDATEGGARKRGTTIMTLAQALKKYATSPIPLEKFDFSQTTQWFDPTPLPQLQRQLEKRIEEVREFQTLCKKTAGLLDKLETLIDTPAEFNKIIIQVDEIRSLVNAHLKALQMVCSVSALAELRRFMHDRQMEARETQGKERAKNQLTRDTEYLQALVKGADELIEILDGALDRVKKSKEENRCVCE